MLTTPDNSKIIKITNILLSILFTIIVLLTSNILLAKNELDYSNFKTIPILHDGRIKPLDTFARITLKNIANKQSINGKTAIHWFIDLLFEPKQDYDKPIFYIHNPDIHNSLNLKTKAKPFYSFKEILPGIKQNINLITSLEKNSNNNEMIFNPAEKQLLELYHKTLLYFDLSRSMSLLLPLFDLTDINNTLNITIQPEGNKQANNKINYLQLLPHKKTIAKQIDNLVLPKNSNKNINPSINKSLLTIATKFKDISQDRININFKIIPDNNIFKQTDNLTGDWLAPWEASFNNFAAKENSIYINLWQDVIYSYYNHNTLSWLQDTNKLQQFSINNIHNDKLELQLKIECLYNYYNLFNKSILLYFISLLAAGSGLLIQSSKNKIYTNKSAKKHNISYRTSVIAFGVATICQLLGLIMRMYILQRPPVANLYESILFVSFIAATLSIIIELNRKDSIGIILGSLICTVLQFIANSYATTGDTLGILIAVLDNNFWLGTHVIAITSGYGCCLLLSALAHCYLLITCLQINYNKHNILLQLRKYILALGLLSLFLTLLGTILGGIWADQSWGRFWGWDPKENGALLICLWLTAILHGRISGHLNELAFITGAALTSITVMLAWFGVNVLGVGLHSYGFTENIALNLLLFIVFELFLVLGLYFIANLLTSRRI